MLRRWYLFYMLLNVFYQLNTVVVKTVSRAAQLYNSPYLWKIALVRSTGDELLQVSLSVFFKSSVYRLILKPVLNVVGLKNCIWKGFDAVELNGQWQNHSKAFSLVNPILYLVLL